MSANRQLIQMILAAVIVVLLGSGCHYQWHRRTMETAKLRQERHTDHGMYLCIPDAGENRLWSISNPVISADSITGTLHAISEPRAIALLTGKKNRDLRPNKRSVILYAMPLAGFPAREGVAMSIPRSAIERVERIKGDTWGTIGLGLLVYLPFAILGTVMENSLL